MQKRDLVHGCASVQVDIRCHATIGTKVNSTRHAYHMEMGKDRAASKASQAWRHAELMDAAHTEEVTYRHK